MSYHRKLPLNPDKKLQAYIIGVAIGDGNLSNPNGRATRLRVSCDKKYPQLFDHIRKSLQFLLPKNKVSFVHRSKNCVDVSVFSNHLQKLLGWDSHGGSKYKQN